MRLGIIGLPQSGKTTIFNALTRGQVPITVSGGRFDVHTAVIDVPDPRVERLSPCSAGQDHLRQGDPPTSPVWKASARTAYPGSSNLLSQMDGLIHGALLENPTAAPWAGRPAERLGSSGVRAAAHT
jgi:GTPase SAR1 family protein